MGSKVKTHYEDTSEGLLHKSTESHWHGLTHGIAVQQEHSMGTAILLQGHVVGVDTIGIQLVLTGMKKRW